MVLDKLRDREISLVASFLCDSLELDSSYTAVFDRFLTSKNTSTLNDKEKSVLITKFSSLYRQEIISLIKLLVDTEIEYLDLSGIIENIKNVLSIPVDYSIEQLEIEEFFSKTKLCPRHDDIAMSLFGPHFEVHALAKDTRVNHHALILIEILKRLYGFDMDLHAVKLSKPLDDLAEEERKRFIEVRYVMDPPEKSAFIFIPQMITLYQYEALQNLDDKLKSLNVETNVYVSAYNPKTDIGQYYDTVYYSKHLIEALTFLKTSDSITDYELPKQIFAFSFDGERKEATPKKG